MTAFQGLLAEGGEIGKRNVLKAKPQLKDLLMVGVCHVRWGSCGDGTSVWKGTSLSAGTTLNKELAEHGEKGGGLVLL